MPTVTQLPQTLEWTWKDLSICYQQAGTSGPPVILIHGFGASSHHWRHNIPVLAEGSRVYAIDLLGYGQSAKPTPGQPLSYTFETWGQQIVDFIAEVVGEPTFLIANSIGCIVAMQAAVMAPTQVRGMAILNCSLRLLHDRKRHTLPWYRSTSAPLIQRLLSYRPLGNFFFTRLAKPRTVSRILKQAYGRPKAVTDELVHLLLEPARDAGAVDVFLSFIRYSQGPLPEDLLPRLTCPTLILWGSADPWEPIELGRSFADYSAVEDFIALPGVGHCPQDEAPEQVNPILVDWLNSTVSGHPKGQDTSPTNSGQ
ncbi:alpha/beta fold hydrolase [Romeria aff. gracilis LEGE 07310]|uniref:Alpha/beta fold hydrolase n=1 Tax=Vasconcelosia minhoensis LEGE 07310 TaxID=915328 RepID=A0A8J7AQ78_9CYAN|nr:alpha/beta fold hydrolase [Romeria gracilis]MBE9078361.1 alpha/beta fold hydrolase [Romeria aff. gracilis LEGE 07310]